MTREASTRLAVPALLSALAIAVPLAIAGASSATVAAGGEPSARPSIVGGKPADFSKWRFAAALFLRKRFLCSGSVIAPTQVLTAAHCAMRFKVRRLAVVVNRPRLRNTGVGSRIRVVAKRVHPDYRRTQRHDLAVLTLATPTEVPSVALATPAEDAAATRAGGLMRVAGWGAGDPLGRRLPGFLKETSETARRARHCKRVYGPAFSGRSMICARGRRIPGGRGIRSQACSGDSGGPLVAVTPAGLRQVGVVSYGTFICGHPRSPDVFARVSDGLAFIEGP